MSRIRGPYVRFCERDEAVTPHPTQLDSSKLALSYLANHLFQTPLSFIG